MAMSGSHQATSRDVAQVRSTRIPFRPDIEGIRAAALFLALLCHGGVSAFSGGFVGVDMFFVISGYLITGLLLVEGERKGRVAIGRFYAQRAKRLLPLSALVLVVVAVGSLVFFSPARRELLSGDVIAAALHVVNWHFAFESVDYFGPETAASPIMHYWSLSIEEQFYLVWALIIGTTVWAWTAGERRFGLRKTLLVVVGVITVASLTYSAFYSASSPSAAYFSTLTRAWEISAGALIALIAIPDPSPWVRRVLVWLGTAAIVYAVVAFDPTTIFPGLAGLFPVLGTGALIIAGIGERTTWLQRLLSSRPFVYVGGLSYAWYLWHYPVMIFGLAHWGSLDVWQTTALVFIAGIPAAITHHLIGQPLRYSKTLSRFPRKALAVGATCTALALAGGALVIASVPSLKGASADEAIGASKVKAPKLQLASAAVTPPPSGKGSRSDRGAIYEEGCLIEPPGTESGECVFGEPGGRRTVVLFGDSHAMHWFGTVERVAQKRNWRIVALTKAGCPPYDVTVYNGKVGREYTECLDWRERALDRIEHEERPAIIFTGGAITHRTMEDGKLLSGPENVERLEDGYRRMLERLDKTGARVIAFEDLPMSPHDMTDCVSENLDRLRRCAFERDAEGHDHFERRAARKAGVEMFDLSPAICDKDDLCHGVIRNVLVYRDNDHMTYTFARTLAPWLERELDRSDRG